MSFYKLDGELLEAPNFVLNAQYHLVKEDHATYTYPVDGWYWFDSIDDAYITFGIQPPLIPPDTVE